jgi:hypothetical protein
MVRAFFPQSFRGSIRTNTNFPPQGPSIGFGQGLGSWTEIARTTLSSPEAQYITITGIPNKLYLMYLYHTFSVVDNTTGKIEGGNGSFLGDPNYAHRFMQDGGNDATAFNREDIRNGVGSRFPDKFGYGFWLNEPVQEKLVICHGMDANSPPTSFESTGKMELFNNPIERLRMSNTNVGGFWDTGSELVVLGWSPNGENSISNNFFQPLVSKDLSEGESDNMDSGIFPIRKYLWLQAYFEASGEIDTQMRFNQDSTMNYEQSTLTDSTTLISETTLDHTTIYESTTGGIYLNMYIVNNATRIKQAIADTAAEIDSDPSTAPSREKGYYIYKDTSNPLTQVNFLNVGTGNFGTKSTLQIWGGD